MPSKYFPFDSTFTGVDSNGIPQGDRGASSADWAAYVSRMFTDGYFKLLDDQLEPSISATPMAVDIAAGSAMIKGRQYSQDETVTMSLGLSDSQPRIDRIVLRMSTEVADRKISLVVLKGTPGTPPVAPQLTRSASVYDICLAQIAVGANAIQIVEDNLTDTREDDALCGYVKLLLDGRYYPEGSIPELLWVYTMFPETLSAGQKAVIEGDSELMAIYEASSNKKVQEALVPLAFVKIMETTVSVDSGTIDIPFSFDLSQYIELILELDGTVSNAHASTGETIYCRVNNVATGIYQYAIVYNGYQVESNSNKTALTLFYANAASTNLARCSIKFRNFSTEIFGDFDFLSVYSSTTRDRRYGIFWCNQSMTGGLQSVQIFSVVPTTTKIKAGTKIIIYGVKK